MNPGRLRDLVTIQNRAAGVDGYGQPNGAWQNVTTCWARVDELDGRELVNAREVVGEVSARVTMRGFPNWRTRIKQTSRIVFGERTFEVLSVINPDGRNDYLQLLVMEFTGS